jgi:hypothetical protein
MSCFKSFYHDICFCFIVDFIKYSTILQSDTRLLLNSAIVLVFIKGDSDSLLIFLSRRV